VTTVPLTTAALPDGTAVVVHTEGRAWTNVSALGHDVRTELVKSVLHCVDVEAMLLGCAALRQASTVAENVAVEDMPHDMLYAQMRVLCTNPECRNLAEHCEKVGEPFLDAPEARAWALTQASPETATEASR
jgi:hypothetical protein